MDDTGGGREGRAHGEPVYVSRRRAWPPSIRVHASPGRSSLTACVPRTSNLYGMFTVRIPDPKQSPRSSQPWQPFPSVSSRYAEKLFYTETMLCGYRITRRQSLLFLVSSTLLVIVLVTLVWRSADGNDTGKAQLAARQRCQPLSDYAADCNGGDSAAANAVPGRRLHGARNSRGLLREKATLQRYELQQAGESRRVCVHAANHTRTLDHPQGLVYMCIVMHSHCLISLTDPVALFVLPPRVFDFSQDGSMHALTLY